MNSAQVQVSFTPLVQSPVIPQVAASSSEFGSGERVEPRWMRDLLVLQVTSIFAAGLFMAVWFAN